MADVLVCTALYEAVRPFLPSYISALRAAAAQTDTGIRALFALDGFSRPEDALQNLGTGIQRYYVDASGTSPAGVRKRLVGAALEISSPVLVFTDADDMLEPRAFDLHLEALQRGDFSFGDQRHVDMDGCLMDRTLFDGMNPGSVAGISMLLDRNFLGFGSTAVWRHRVTARAADIPSAVVAADWWFFSILILDGLIGAQTTEPVVRYRQHPQNLLGPRADPNLTAFLSRCRVARLHYQHLPIPEAVARLNAIERTIAAIEREPSAWTGVIERACQETGVWFEDVWRVARPFLALPPAPDELSPRA